MGALHHVRGVKGWGWLPRSTASGQEVCGKLGHGDGVCGLLGASVSAPPGWNPCRGAPGGEQAAAGGLPGAAGTLGQAARRWLSSGPYGWHARLQGQTGPPAPGTLGPGSQPRPQSSKHTQPAGPAAAPGRTGTFPTAPSSAALLPATGPAPRALGDRWRAVEVINSRAPPL